VVGCAVRNGLKGRRVVGRTVGIAVGIVMRITTCKRRKLSITKRGNNNPHRGKLNAVCRPKPRNHADISIGCAKLLGCNKHREEEY
jgi:hypothetical protein